MTSAHSGDQKDEAFIGLERACSEHFINLPYLIYSRFYANLHSDPRWHALLARMKLGGAAVDATVAARNHL
jgi:hypothetical protein